MASCRGSFRALLLYNIAEAIELDALRRTFGTEPAGREPSFAHPAPEYVRFERPPAVEPLPPFQTSTGHHWQGRLKYYDYGVVSAELEHFFEIGWEELVHLSAAWIGAAEIEQLALGFVRDRVKPIGATLIKPYPEWLNEDYYIVHLRDAVDDRGAPYTAQGLLAAHGHDLARLVRGETQLLSDQETAEVLRASISYYPNDLLVAGWFSAFVYDSPPSAVPTIQLLEYANTQLLEYRHYDELLTRLLSGVYKSLERHAGPFARWRLAREAERLNTLRLDITELAERTDNSIKFLSDLFYARQYRVMAERVGVGDYRRLVDDKLRTAGELYQFMMNEFHQGRAFVLELMVVVILIIDLIYLFRGH
ncbi:MAG: hypothetical protein SFV54_10035 [Bryobacteraceae bacterium]|nr:hypothetical protein [Bryobacteraceae bacterium]